MIMGYFDTVWDDKTDAIRYLSQLGKGHFDFAEFIFEVGEVVSVIWDVIEPVRL